MKRSRTLIAMTLVAGLTLVGCGSNNASSDSSNGNQNNSNQSSSSSSQDKTASIKTGVDKLLSISGDLKQAIAAGDDSKIKSTAPQLEDTWKTFEDDVKAKYPDSYGEVEQYLNPTVAGSKASQLDKATLGKLNDQLNNTLVKLSQMNK